MSSRNPVDWLSDRHPNRLLVRHDVKKFRFVIACQIPGKGIAYDYMHPDWFNRPGWRNHVAAVIRRCYRALKELQIDTQLPPQ